MLQYGQAPKQILIYLDNYGTLICDTHIHTHLFVSLDVQTGASPDWRKCDAIAQIIANCPTNMKSTEEYYRVISPQVCFFNMRVENTNKYFDF